MARLLSVALLLAALSSCRSDERPDALPRALSAGAQPSAPLSFGTSATDHAFSEQIYGATAYGGGVFLTAWTDTNIQRIFVARTRASDGKLLDERRISIATENYQAPVVGSDGQNFLVVWPGGAVRVSADGTVVDKTPLTLSVGVQMAIAYGGGYYLVLGQAEVDLSTHQRDIRAVRVRASDGTVAGPVISVTTRPTLDSLPAAAFDGTNFLVVWQDERGGGPVPYGNRIRASDGAVLDGADGFRIGTSTSTMSLGQRPAVAFGGGNYLVVWSATASSLAGARIRPSDGASLDATDLPLVPVSEGNAEFVRLAHDGTRFVMTWLNPGRDQVWRFRAARIDAATGTNLDGAGKVVATTPEHEYNSTHDLAAGAGKIFETFNYGDVPADYLHNTEVVAVKGVFIDPATGGAGQPLLLTKSAHWQEAPAASFDGQRHLLAWHEWTGSRFEVRGARVSNDSATVLDPDGFTISGAGTTDQGLPRSASNGSNHLVVWADGFTLRAKRVNGDGTPLEGAGIALPSTRMPSRSGFDAPQWDVASDGTDYLVLWLEGGSDPMQVRAARIRGSDGALLDTTAIAVSPPSKVLYYAKLAFAGPHYVATWIRYGYPPDAIEVQAARVTSGGSALDATPLVISTVDGFTKNPVVAGDGQNALLAWTDLFGLKARRLRVSDGALLDSSDLVLPNQSRSSTLTFDGENFVFVGPAAILPNGLAAQRVSKSGTPLGPSIPITSTPDYVERLAVSAGASGKLLVGYALYDDTADYQTKRVRAHLLGDPVAAPDAAVVSPAPDAAADQAAPADLAVIVDAGAPAQDASTPDAGLPDGGTARPDAAATADLAPPVDDGARSPVDAAAAVDGGSQDLGAIISDGGTSPVDAKSNDGSVANASSGDASPASDAAHDAAAAEGPGSSTSCDCHLSGRPRSGRASLAFVALALLFRLRRRR